MVAKNKLKVIWSTKASQSLEYYYKKIKKDSLTNANKVRDEIFKTTKILPNTPYCFQLDEYYPNNPGNIRRFFKWSYRIVYEVNEETIDILNVYHTRRSTDKIGS